MNITPVTKKYTNPYNACSISFAKKSNVSKDLKNPFYYPQTSVKNTLNEFSNSRGNCLADIELCDIYIPNKSHKNVAINGVDNNLKIKQDKRNIQFLADIDLADTFEISKKDKKDKNLQLPFNGAYPQFLIDQDAVEQYETTSNGVQDIAQSSYCSFKGSQKEETIFDMFLGFVKSHLPL